MYFIELNMCTSSAC